MAEILVSPGIQITETDRSFVPARPLVAGAAIIGPTVKGPANVPVVVTSYGDFQRTFGTTFMLNRYKENYKEIVEEAAAAKESETVPYTRVEGEPETVYVVATELEDDGTYFTKNENEEYVEYTEKDDEGHYIKEEGVTYYKQESLPTYTYTPLDKDEESGLYNFETDEEGQIIGDYYSKKVEEVLNEETCEYEPVETYSLIENLTTPEAYKEEVDKELTDSDEIWENAKLQQKSQEFLTSIAAKSYFEQGGESLLVERVVDNEFRSGRAVISTENGEKTAFVIRTLSEGEYLNNWDKDAEFQDRTVDTASIDGVIREDGSLVKGTKDNIRWEIADVDPDTGTFSIYVRRGDDVDYDKAILEVFSGLTLDPDSTNYIARRIGDQYQELFEEPDPNDTNKKIYYVNTFGNYPNVSKYIRVEEVNDIYGYFLADGFTRRGSEDDPTATKTSEGKAADDSCIISYPDDVANLLPKTCEGGFYDAEGKLFSSHEDEAKALFFEDIQNVESGVGDAVKIQGIDPAKYDPLIAVLENQDEYEIDIISVPGLTAASNLPQTDAVVSLAQKRGDCIAVIDLVGFGSMIAEVQNRAMSINNNYAATYWPWLQMYSSTGRLEWVPASVVIPGVYVYNDHVAAPWFAPAGMIRGSVQGVVQPERKLLKQHRDALYKKNVNPISILPGNGITIYGQKTLQKKATALDRVNVRRLLIELKRTVKNMASGILFEQNDAQLRGAFKANLDQYLESVVKRRGLYGYHTEVESQNTPDVIDRNEFRAKIWIQPTKVIEFIYIDFTITNTGVEFNS